jgi:hypothetical protein
VLYESKRRLIKTYASETEFFESDLKPDTLHLAPRSHLLVEVGSGVGLLAMKHVVEVLKYLRLRLNKVGSAT